jgi:ornithine decarboxylase
VTLHFSGGTHKTLNIEEYIPKETWQKIKEFSKDLETPFLVVNLESVKTNFELLKRKNFSQADIFYAVKANPHIEVLSLLSRLGSCFDAASIYELDKLFSIGVEPSRISYGNTIKKVKHIQYAYEKGIRLFATDSLSDLQNIGKYAPGSKVFIRLLVEGSTSADWPLARKFGCSIEKVKYLIHKAMEIDVEVYGLSFHVGSQQRDVYMWDYALLKVKDIFDWAKDELGIELQMINMGGGFPSKYIQKAEDLSIYAENVLGSLDNHFGDSMPRIILEPGRSMVGDTGVLVSEIVMVSKKSHHENHRWVYLDVGKFNGLIETLDECIKYPIYCEKDGEEGEVILAGPTCDSMDIMYEHYRYELPLSLEEGDRLYWLTTGAYTSSYCAVEFNGFPPMKTYVI